MVELTEFIIASRANKIIRNSKLTDISYTGLNKAEYGFYNDTTQIKLNTLNDNSSYQLQKRLEDILYLIFPGTKCQRFIGVEDTIDDRYFYPITVATIFSNDKKAFIPFFFGKETLFIISPFVRKEETSFIGDKFVIPICKISEINTETLLVNLDTEITKPCPDNENTIYGPASLAERFRIIIDELTDIISPICSAIQKAFPSFEYSVESEVISSKEKGYYRLYERFGMEAELMVDKDLGLLENPQDIIADIDFLPIVLKNEEDDKTRYLTLTLLEKQDNESSRVIRNVRLEKEINEPRSTDEIVSRITGNLDETKPKGVINELLVLRETGNIYPLISLDDSEFYSNKKIVFILNGEVVDTLPIEDIYELRKGYPEVKEVNKITDDGREYIHAEEGVADILSTIKEIGIRAGSTLYGILAPIVKLPKEMATTIFQFIRRTFLIKQNTTQKELTEELKIKALNDDLDIFTGKVERWLEAGTIGIASFFLCGNIIVGFLAWYIFNKMAKQSRARAMEPLEHHVNTIIQTVDMKIRFAESEGDTKKIEELMKYRGHLLLMKHKVENYKKEITGKTQLEYSKVNEVERTGGGY